MAIEIVDLPIEDGDFPVRYVNLPEGKWTISIYPLVGGLEHFLFFHILGISSSQLTNSYFSEGLKINYSWLKLIIVHYSWL